MGEVGWYYDVAGQPVGPVGQAAVVELIRSGQLAQGTRVWRPGLASWAAWETVPDLASQVAPPLEGPPPFETSPAAAAPPFSRGGRTADVLTGVGVGAPYPKAPIGARVLAALVDQLVSSVPAGLLVVAAVSSFLGDATGFGVLFSLLAFAAVTWAFFYSFTKDGRPGGQSIGKKMMGLMVVHLPSNRPCTGSQSALRFVVMFLLSLILGAGWLVELIVLLIEPGGRRLGDFAAGTQVVEASAWRPHR
jgi:uncharacterized RDD family membrane protein YckC